MIAFQFPVAWGPDFPPETLARLATIPQIIGLKEASFDTTKTVETIDTARALPRKIGILTGSDTFILEAMIMGCDGALIGFAGTATAELIEMHAAVVRRDYERAHAIWARLGPLARYCWRAPIRDYRPRMKEVLELQGLIPARDRARAAAAGRRRRARRDRAARAAGGARRHVSAVASGRGLTPRLESRGQTPYAGVSPSPVDQVQRAIGARGEVRIVRDDHERGADRRG